MKRRIAALGLVLASALALAQDAPPPPPHGSPNASSKHPYAQRMKDNLGLTDEQVAKMREIRDNGGSREEMQAVLTPEQKAKMAQMRRDHSGDRAQIKERLQQELGLSDEQMEKMNQIRRDGGSREEMRAVLTPQQQEKFDALRSSRSAPEPAPAP